MLNNNICKTLILFTLLSFGMKLEAQETKKRKFMEGDCQFSIALAHVQSGNIPSCSEYWTRTSLSIKDTIMNGIAYQHIGVYDIAFRIDTITRKVYFRKGVNSGRFCAMDTSEFLAYDFASQPGDTVNLGGCDPQPRLAVVEKVDTITLLDGYHYRKQYLKFLNFGYGMAGADDILIEGIGSIFHPLNFLFYNPGTFKTFNPQTLDEYWINGQLIYNSDACKGLHVMDRAQELSLKVFPSPLALQDNLQLQIPKLIFETPKLSIQFYDNLGRAYAAFDIHYSETSVPAAYLPPDPLFHYRIINQQQQILHSGTISRY